MVRSPGRGLLALFLLGATFASGTRGQIPGEDSPAQVREMLLREPLEHTRERLRRSREQWDGVMSLDPAVAKFVSDAVLVRAEKWSTVGNLVFAAEVVQDLLAGTDLHYRRGSPDWMPGVRHGPSPVPELGYPDVARMLERALAMPWSRPDRRKYTVALAKAYLLMGDFAAMNRTLETLGISPVVDAEGGFLSTPPSDWSDLDRDWTLCDEALRDGRSRFTVEVFREGAGQRGAHVRLRPSALPAELPAGAFTTSRRVDHLGHAPRALASDLTDETFGDGSFDRSQTRYSVTDEAGIASFDHLPGGYYEIEVLVPVGNFPSAQHGWELWIDGPEGGWEEDFRDHSRFPIHVAEGVEVRHPRIEVRPQLDVDLAPWQAIDPRDFRLGWTSVAGASRFRVTLSLALPGPGIGMLAEQVVDSVEIETEAHFLEAREGVLAGVPLVAGNVHHFRVEALDASGAVVARSPTSVAYVPWNDRPTLTPRTSRFVAEHPLGQWEMTEAKYYSTVSGLETFRKRLDLAMTDAEDDFEYPYAKVLRASLHWRDGETERASHVLGLLAAQLPQGNLAGDTARSLLARITEGAFCPTELHFLAAWK